MFSRLINRLKEKSPVQLIYYLSLLMVFIGALAVSIYFSVKHLFLDRFEFINIKKDQYTITNIVNNENLKLNVSEVYSLTDNLQPEQFMEINVVDNYEETTNKQMYGDTIRSSMGVRKINDIYQINIYFNNHFAERLDFFEEINFQLFSALRVVDEMILAENENRLPNYQPIMSTNHNEYDSSPFKNSLITKQ